MPGVVAVMPKSPTGIKPRADSAAASPESPSATLKKQLIRNKKKNKSREELELSHKPMSSRRSIIKKVGPGTPEIISEQGRKTISMSGDLKSG